MSEQPQQTLALAGIPIRSENDMAFAGYNILCDSASIPRHPTASRCAFCGAKFMTSTGEDINHLWRAFALLTDSSNHTCGAILLFHCRDCNPMNQRLQLGSQEWQIQMKPSPSWKTVQGEV